VQGSVKSIVRPAEKRVHPLEQGDIFRRFRIRIGGKECLGGLLSLLEHPEIRGKRRVFKHGQTALPLPEEVSGTPQIQSC